MKVNPYSRSCYRWPFLMAIAALVVSALLDVACPQIAEHRDGGMACCE